MTKGYFFSMNGYIKKGKPTFFTLLCIHWNKLCTQLVAIMKNKQLIKMKKLLPLVFFMAFQVAFAQQMDRNKMNFSFVQYPTTPVGGVENYNTTVIIGYEGQIEQMKQQYQADLAQAEADYQRDLANHPDELKRADDEYAQALEVQAQQQKVADEQYEKDLKTYNKGGFLIGHEKPTRKTIPMPTKRVVPEPQRRVVPEPNYPKLFDANTLAGQITIDGLSKVNNNALQVIVTLKGFEVGEPMYKETKKSKKDKEGNVTTIVTHFAQVQYRHPVHVQVVSPTGATLMDEVIGGGYATHTTPSYSNKYQVDNYLQTNPYKNNLEDNVVPTNMAALKQTLNNNFGFILKNREMIVAQFSHKKMDYPEYTEAYEYMIGGTKKLDSRDTKAEGIEKIQKAIAAWEKAMQESDPDNRKARINKKVTKATHLMLAEAYMWAEDFDNAERQLNKLEVIGVAGRDKKEAAEIQALLDSQKQRITAYKQANP